MRLSLSVTAMVVGAATAFLAGSAIIVRSFFGASVSMGLSLEEGS